MSIYIYNNVTDLRHSIQEDLTFNKNEYVAKHL